MGSVNVNRSVSDAFYRYKMPRIQAKVEGKGNGIKTVIVNMADVAKALGRPATCQYIYQPLYVWKFSFAGILFSSSLISDPTKYFGCELGAQTNFDFKNDRYIVNGSHDAGKLQDLLDGFIRKFVLCPQCDNPETVLSVQAKKATISQGCKACGYHGTLDFNHKLNTYILKNPPSEFMCHLTTFSSSSNCLQRFKSFLWFWQPPTQLLRALPLLKVNALSAPKKSMVKPMVTPMERTVLLIMTMKQISLLRHRWLLLK